MQIADDHGEGGKMPPPHADVGTLLDLTFDPDARVRRRAVSQLCPCHLKRNDPRVWDRVLSLAGDPDRNVRNWVLHVLTDGSPRSRIAEVVRALEGMEHDVDPKLRRKARQVLAHFRRTGVLNIS
jgi:hypothetical protein